MAKLGFFDHDSANGTPWWRRVERGYGVGRGKPFSTWRVGENLAWGSPVMDAAEAMALWIGSPAHKRNLRDPKWRHVGVAAYRVGQAADFYEDHDVTIIATDYGMKIPW